MHQVELEKPSSPVIQARRCGKPVGMAKTVLAAQRLQHGTQLTTELARISWCRPAYVRSLVKGNEASQLRSWRSVANMNSRERCRLQKLTDRLRPCLQCRGRVLGTARQHANQTCQTNAEVHLPGVQAMGLKRESSAASVYALDLYQPRSSSHA